jgi:DNA-binding transcriptional MerR regulator
MRVGGVTIDTAVAEAFLKAINPAATEAALLAEKNIETDHDTALEQWRLQVERFSYKAERAERRFGAVEPENRLVARTLEIQWEVSLKKLQDAENEFERRRHQHHKKLTQEQKTVIRTLGNDIKKIWYAPTTTPRDKKELLQTLLQEVNITLDRPNNTARLIVRWKTEAILELDIDLPRRNSPPIRTKQDTIDLVRRLAVHYADATIAGILNRQGRHTAYGHRFTVGRVGNLRRHWKIPKFNGESADNGELMTIGKTAKILGIAPSTIHRWLADGVIAGEQITPGAPWRIRITDKLRAQFVKEAPDGYVTMKEAKSILGVSRQTVLNRVKAGKLSAIHVRQGKQVGLYLKLTKRQLELC